MDNTKIGAFSIDRKIVDMLDVESVRKIFDGIVILEAISDVRDDAIHYIAIGDIFDKLDTNETRPELMVNFEVPEYELDFNFDDKYKVSSFEFKKLKTTRKTNGNVLEYATVWIKGE